MTKTHRARILTKRLGALALTSALAVTLAACSSGSGSSSTAASSGSAITQAQVTAALQKKSTITVWGWAPQLKPIVAAFEKKYPNVTVKVQNVGTGNDEYTKLQNAIKAGSGGPDVAQIEYYALPQFALSKSLADLTQFGGAKLESSYSASTWSSVTQGSAIYGLPQDSGPMAMFYRADIFKKYGLSVPTTWAEYTADAKKLHKADPSAYITNDTGDAGFTTSMIWQAGGKPYVTSGTSTVDINLQDTGAKKFADMWSPLVDQGLVAPISSWTSEWYKGLASGDIATLITGAWMPGDLESGVPTAKGDWRVAPVPTYTAGTAASSENGGSADAVLQNSSNKTVAYGFTEFMNGATGEKIFTDQGGFPASTAILDSKSFLDKKDAYFGGQELNKVLVQSSKDVLSGWSYLPYQTYANSVFGDTVGQAYENKTSLNSGLVAWQNSSVKYGKAQGFTVKAG